MYLWQTPLGQSPRRGTVAIFVAVCLTVILGVVAIALDGGMLLTERRHAQAVADAAALSAACDLYLNKSRDTAIASAQATAQANGYTITPTINIPPSSASPDHAGQAGYAEVYVYCDRSRTFSSIFGSGALLVSARAVAGIVTTNGSKAGIIVLNPTVSQALNVTGPGSVTVKSGSIIVDSSNSQAAVITGSGSVSATEVDITGKAPGYSCSNSGTFITTPTSGNVKTGRPPTPDPLGSLPVPDTTTMTVQSSQALNISKDTVLYPGRYVGGINISGGNVSLQPGVYYMDHGGFSVSNGSLTAHEVMIYNDPQPGSGQKVAVTGGTFDITAPISGTYQGIAIFQARGAGNVPVAITGPGTCKMLGTVYASGSPVQVTGSGGATIGSQFICDTLTVTGAGPFSVDWAGSPTSGTRSLKLVE